MTDTPTVERSHRVGILVEFVCALDVGRPTEEHRASDQIRCAIRDRVPPRHTVLSSGRGLGASYTR